MFIFICTFFVYRMGSALLSRFDVVFLLLDIPDESHDRRLSEHVMANRAGRGSTSSAIVTRSNNELETSILLQHSSMPLSERLQVNTCCPHCPPEWNLISKLIRFYVHIFQDPCRRTCGPHSSMLVKEVHQLRSSVCSPLALSWSSTDTSGLLFVTEVSGTLCWFHAHHHTTAGVFN